MHRLLSKFDAKPVNLTGLFILAGHLSSWLHEDISSGSLESFAFIEALLPLPVFTPLPVNHYYNEIKISSQGMILIISSQDLLGDLPWVYIKTKMVSHNRLNHLNLQNSIHIDSR